jgi:hypothetical protein
MNLYTLAQIREKTWRWSPVPKVPYASSTTAQKALADSYINQVCERLLGRMKPRFSMRRVNVPVYSGTLTVPRELDGIDGIEMVDANNCACSPLQIYSRFHEWARPALNCCCSSAVFVLSDMVQTFKDPDASTDGYYLRVKTTESGGGDMTFTGGFDDDWDQLFGEVTLAFVSGTYTTSQIWKSLPRIQKPVTTNYVELYGVDVATNEETLIAVYAPGERIPAYKRYKVPDWPGLPMARIFGKLAYNEVTADNDIPVPQNIGALKAGLQALSYEDAADMQRSDMLWARAVSILDEERAESEDAETPVFKVDSDFGIGSITQVF